MNQVKKPEKRITHVSMYKDVEDHFRLTKGMKSQGDEELAEKQPINRQMSLITEQYRGDNNILIRGSFII